MILFKLQPEEDLLRNLLDDYDFFLCSLLPNNINVFQLVEIDEYIIKYIEEQYYFFRYLIFPVYKHLWRKKKIFIDNNKLICNWENSTNTEFYVYNEDILKDIFLKDDIEIDYNKNCLYIKKLNLYASYEAYSYLYLHIFRIINSQNLNYLFILGVLEASIDIGFCSIPFKQNVTKNIPFKQNTTNRRSVFNFSKISLKSLYITNQILIFKAWLNKSDILLTGDTGIGKTSQIPKLFWWINFLYDGFAINFKNFSFNLNKIPEIKTKSTVLSLPRKILITENATNVAKSLGFNSINNSPINCIYKDVKNTIYYNNTANKYINPFVFSINRITSIFNVNTLIFDEIHEHDTYADIGITKAKYYKKRNKINNIVLISATVSDDLDSINKFLPNIQRIHIKGDTLYEITTIDYSKNFNDTTDLAKIIKKHSTDIGKSTLIFLPSLSYIRKIHNELKVLINTAFYIFIELHRELLSQRDIISEINSYPKQHVIILSTPVAESSLTIINVKVVIDYGLFYCKQFYSGSKMYITDSMMKQRKGRIGRVSTGTYIHVFPLYKLNKNFKKIDYEFLLPYIINCYYFNIKFEDIFILPSDMSRFDKTIQYFNSKNVDIKKNINKIYDIFNNYYVTMYEYIIIYLFGNDALIDVLNTLDSAYDKESVIKFNSIIIEKIAKIMKIKFNILKNYDNISYKIHLIDYYENMPPVTIKILQLNKHDEYKYLIDPMIGVKC